MLTLIFVRRGKRRRKVVPFERTILHKVITGMERRGYVVEDAKVLHTGVSWVRFMRLLSLWPMWGIPLRTLGTLAKGCKRGWTKTPPGVSGPPGSPPQR